MLTKDVGISDKSDDDDDDIMKSSHTPLMTYLSGIAYLGTMAYLYEAFTTRTVHKPIALRLEK